MNMINPRNGSMIPLLTQIPQGTGGTSAAGPQDELAIARAQVSDKEAQAAQDMKTLEKAQHKSNVAGKWETRFGKISGKAGRLSLPLFIASLGTGLAASFLAIPALATVATIASTVCTVNLVTWLGGMGASKLSGMARKKAEKNLPALTGKVQMENKELVGLKQQVGRLSAQQPSTSAATAPAQQPAATKPAASGDPVKKPTENAVQAVADDDDEPPPAPKIDVTSDDSMLDVGGIRLRKNQ